MDIEKGDKLICKYSVEFIFSFESPNSMDFNTECWKEVVERYLINKLKIVEKVSTNIIEKDKLVLQIKEE